MSRALRAYTSTVGVGLTLALLACASNQFGAPCPVPDKATPEQRQAALAACYGVTGEKFYPAGVQKDVDILFVIDNSPSMAPKQLALAKNIPKFIQKIDSFGADYHVGITTSDVGSTTADGATWQMDPGNTISTCNNFRGDDGLLQIKPCTDRSLQGQAKSACNMLCPDGRFVPTDGSRFISKVRGVTNVPVDIKGGVDLGPAEAFQCIALVGDAGCGIEGQLEGAKRALDGHRPENNGFLRNGAVLAVIFITDEDDCSVQLSRRYENNPTTRDCTNPDQNASYDCFNFDYRCLARSVTCDTPMNTSGAKTNCRERPDNYLSSVKGYHDFISSIPYSPDKLVVSGIWTLPSLDKGGQLSVSPQGPSNTSQFLNRDGGALASCQYKGSDPNFTGVFGQAQRRLSAFANTFGTEVDPDTGQVVPAALELSICDIDGYDRSLDEIAKKIKKRFGPMCLPVRPKSSYGQPVCLVGDVDANSPNSFPDKLLPVCSSTCCQAWANAANPAVDDPGIVSACTDRKSVV